MHSKNTNACTQEAGSFRGTNLDRGPAGDRPAGLEPVAGGGPERGSLERGDGNLDLDPTPPADSTLTGW